jgi:hypothetical protein
MEEGIGGAQDNDLRQPRPSLTHMEAALSLVVALQVFRGLADVAVSWAGPSP